MKTVVTILLLLFPPIFSFASGLNYSQNDSVEHSHSHNHSHWELGVASGSVLLLAEDEVALGLHLHVLRKTHFWKNLSLGVGFETVFDEHTHFNTAFVGAVDVWKGLVIAISPGVLFLYEENRWGKDFSSHFEVLYHFKVGKVHIGPTMEYSYSKHDKHLMLGLHLGLHL